MKVEVPGIEPALNSARTVIDKLVNWLTWAATITLLLIVVAKVAATQGLQPPLIRYSLDNLSILYLAGIIWLLKR